MMRNLAGLPSSFPGHRPDKFGGRPDPRWFLGMVVVEPAAGPLAYYAVFHTPEGRYVADAEG
jgi:hypothetical protein